MATRTTTRSQKAKVAQVAPNPTPAAAAQKQKLSFLGGLDMIPGLAVIVSTALLSFLTGFVRTGRDSKTYYLHVANTILRKATERLSPLQLQ